MRSGKEQLALSKDLQEIRQEFRFDEKVERTE